MHQDDVDKWVQENGEIDASSLFHEKMPRMGTKLNRAAKKLSSLLEEISKTFPQARYYTASGGFNLILGETHDDSNNCEPQRQRSAWSSDKLEIGDGDW